MSTPAGRAARARVTRSGDGCVTPLVTRSKSLTLTYRQRSGKRVTTRHQPEKGDASQIDVVARAHVRAHKDTNQENTETRHPKASR